MGWQQWDRDGEVVTVGQGRLGDASGAGMVRW